MHFSFFTRGSSRLIAAGVFAASLALVPALVACGSSSDSGGSSPSSQAPDARTTALEKVVVSGDVGGKPTVTFDPAYVGDKEGHIVLVPGTGEEIRAGQRVTVNYVATNGNDGSELDSTYDKTPQNIILDQSSLLAPVYDAMVGQKVGARVLVSADVTEAQGTWILFVFDILSAQDVPTAASGTPVTPPAGLPVVTVVDGVPTITPPTGTPPTTLIAQVLIKGNGPVITSGQTVLMQYTGMIWASGEVFDSSWGGAPVEFPVGLGQVIPGFDEGLVGQTIGSRVLLVIPPEKGYGAEGNADAGIAGTDTLIFVVDLLLAS
ncbi:MAG: FKBP-type peptidyl-prolyl cis-trans isomerase [Acidimicrobiales bacterium]